MNPLYQQLSQSTTNSNNIIKRFQDFKKNFTGNPQQQVQQLLNSGKVTQEQYNKAVQIAQNLQKMLMQ